LIWINVYAAVYGHAWEKCGSVRVEVVLQEKGGINVNWKELTQDGTHL
jgi:hypothetical protein